MVVLSRAFLHVHFLFFTYLSYHTTRTLSTSRTSPCSPSRQVAPSSNLSLSSCCVFASCSSRTRSPQHTTRQIAADSHRRQKKSETSRDYDTTDLTEVKTRYCASEVIVFDRPSTAWWSGSSQIFYRSLLGTPSRDPFFVKTESRENLGDLINERQHFGDL